MSNITPSKSKKPALAICNRCIPYINEDLTGRRPYSRRAWVVLIRCAENTCNRDAGPLGKKCPRCATGRHSCVPVEYPLFGSLKTCKEARDALARSNERGDSAQVVQMRTNRAIAAGQQLIDDLAAFKVNRNRTTADRQVNRKRGATAAQGTDPVLLAEVQSIRRGLFALVEVGKAVSLSFSFRWRHLLIASAAPAEQLRQRGASRANRRRPRPRCS
jgi:hypothetical protein